MSASASRPLRQPERFGLLWWLPPGGHGNGLTDAAWAPVADVDVAIVRALLAEFRTAGVPAYAAPVTVAGLYYRIWVGTSRYSQAEETLRVRLPVLLSRARQRRASRGRQSHGGEEIRDQHRKKHI
jgi:hypothetical protein